MQHCLLSLPDSRAPTAALSVAIAHQASVVQLWRANSTRAALTCALNALARLLA